MMHCNASPLNKINDFEQKENLFSFLKKILSPKLKCYIWCKKKRKNNETISHFLMKSKQEILNREKKEKERLIYIAQSSGVIHSIPQTSFSEAADFMGSSFVTASV